jgi:EmrB/QacA subfamily drug resistance transporter
MSAAATPVDSTGGVSHRRRNLAVFVICAVQMMTVLDVTIVNVALPSIRRDLNISETNLQWIVTVYVLTFGGLLLLGGRVGDLFGRRRMFSVGVAIFTLSSMLGGAAPNDLTLIGARVGQGLGAAIAAPTALALIANLFAPGRERNKAMGIYAGASSVGGAVGQILGGTLVEVGSWRWVFFVNVPVGVVVLVTAAYTLPRDEARRGKLDLPGALTGTAGMSLLVYALAHASSGGWTSPTTVVSFVAALFLLAAFLLVERRSPQPLMPLRIWRDRNRSAAYGISLLLGASITPMYFFITQFVQDVLGYSPVQAGLAFVPLSLGITLSAYLTSRLVGRAGMRTPMVIGLPILILGLLWISRVNVNTHYWAIVSPMLLVAAGMGLTNVPLALLIVAKVRRSEAGVTSAILNATQQVGASLGLAALTTIAATTTMRQLRHLTDGHGTILPSAVSADTYRLAVTVGYRHALLAGACIAMAALVLAALVRIRPSTDDERIIVLSGEELTDSSRPVSSPIADEPVGG